MGLQNIKRYARKGLLVTVLATALLSVGANGVASGQAQDDELGNFRGHKWNDVNGNGANDEANNNSFNLNGWTINLYAPGENPADPWEFQESVVTGHTNNRGVFAFTDYPWGTYYVCEVPQDGWQQTWPLPAVTVPVIADPYAPGQYCYVATIQDGSTDDEREINLNFGNQVIPDEPEDDDTGSLHGRKFRDVNANGFRDLEDREASNRLDGWSINLYDASWNWIGSTVTSASEHGGRGTYRFTDLPWGTYYTCEVLQAGWTQTHPFGGLTGGTANSSPNAATEGSFCRTGTIMDGDDGPGTDTSDEREREMNFGNIESIDEEPEEEPEEEQEEDPGQVLGDTDDNDNPANLNNDGSVLGDTDTADSNGEVLAETGVGSLPYIVIGSLLVLVPTALAVQTRKQD